MTTPPNTPPIELDPERLLGFQSLAGEAGSAEDWSASLTDLHNKIGEVPPPPP